MADGIEELRDHLFATLAALRDEKNPMEIDRAKAVAEVAGKIIETAKAEVAFMNAAGGQGSGFIPLQPRALPKPDKR